MTDPGTVLIIEDDPNTASLIATYLQREGFTTRLAGDGESGLASARSYQPNLVILDLMLPKLDGWEVCRQLRKISDLPVLMLSARDDEIDRILGLSIGADDYVVKPFSPRELVERVKAILRRARPAQVEDVGVLTRSGLTLDPDRHRVTSDHREIDLTPTEFKLLHALMAAPGRVFSRESLLGHIYRQEDAVVDRVIDVHIGKLRQKLDDSSDNPRFIETVRGVGYRFVEQERGHGKLTQGRA